MTRYCVIAALLFTAAYCLSSCAGQTVAPPGAGTITAQGGDTAGGASSVPVSGDEHPTAPLETTAHKIEYPPIDVSDAPSGEFFITRGDFTPSPALTERINSAIVGDVFRTGFYLEAIDGSVAMGYNPNLIFPGASTIKAAVALYAYREIEEGRVSFDEAIGGQTLGSLLDRMLRFSDNNAYHALRDRFGKENINVMLAELGCPAFILKPNYDWGSATPAQAAALWRGIYDFYANSGNGALFIGQMAEAVNNYAMKALGKYTIPHKYGYMRDDYPVFAVNCMVLKDEGRSYIYAYFTDADWDDNNLGEVLRALDEIMLEFDAFF